MEKIQQSTMDDLNKKFDKMLVEQISMKEDLKNFVTRDEFINGKNEILNAVDEIKKTFDNHQVEHMANIDAHDRFEKRISRLEKKAVGA